MKFITFDLGTGGLKAALYDNSLHVLMKYFIEYPTLYIDNYKKEQNPRDWWEAIKTVVKKFLDSHLFEPSEITYIALSGASCCCIPVDREGSLLTPTVPIWSDMRAEEEKKEFFSRIDEKKWYYETGNGFPAECYGIFKLMWIKKHQPNIYSKIETVLGSKDYINFLLTGVKRTDYSYAASLGVYDLKKKKIDCELLKAAGIEEKLFPKIVSAYSVLGYLKKDIAHELGLSESTIVICGGVDNACMALGSVGTEPGKVYVSLGSSSWIPVNSVNPVLDFQTKPYVFPTLDERGFTSAYSIFAGGSSYQWARNTLCTGMNEKDVYKKMDELAAKSSVGANGIIFNPTLAGSTTQDKGSHMKGAFTGLQLSSGIGDLLRSVLEGVALKMNQSLLLLKKQTSVGDEILFFGGGSKSPLWMQIFSDVFNMRIVTTNISQDAASLGAAALCAKASGIWDDFSAIPSLHEIRKVYKPDPRAVNRYNQLKNLFNIIDIETALIGEEENKLMSSNLR